jgi:DNA polymerase-3 subunit gamma/tau
MTQLLENAVYAPTVGRYKVYVIDEVHMLSTHAFNAMLKTLEEPPPHVVFVLATTDPQKVPVTVLSRCLQFNLKNMSPADIAEHLARVLDAESIAFERPALAILGRAAAGSMRDALSLLDQAIAFGAGSVRERAVRAMLGAVDRETLLEIVEALVGGEGAALMALADRLYEDNRSFSRALEELSLLLHRVALLQAGLHADLEDGDSFERLERCARAVTPETIQVWYQVAIHGGRDLSLAPDERSGFSMTLLRMLAFRPDWGAEHDPSESAAPRKIPPPVARPVADRPPSIARPVAASAPPRPAAPPALASPPEPERPAGQAHGAIAFDGDWPALARRLRLSGFARQFMDQSELLAASEEGFHVRVPIKALAEGATVAKVGDALSAALGRSVRLKVEVGAVRGLTAAVLAEQDRGERLEQARSAIESDPFVRALVTDFDASIVPGSISPVAEHPAEPKS